MPNPQKKVEIVCTLSAYAPKAQTCIRAPEAKTVRESDLDSLVLRRVGDIVEVEVCGLVVEV